MDTLNSTHYKTESVNFLGLMNSALISLSYPKLLNPEGSWIEACAPRGVAAPDTTGLEDFFTQEMCIRSDALNPKQSHKHKRCYLQKFT